MSSPTDLPSHLHAVLRHPRWMPARARPGRSGTTAPDDMLALLDAAALEAAARRAGDDPRRGAGAIRAEIARQLLAARVLVERPAADDDALLALVAGAAVAVLVLGPLPGERLPGLLAALAVAAVLSGLLWRRWRRGRRP